jgi:hypothetical protein
MHRIDIDLEALREAIRSGASARQLTEQFGVSRSVIDRRLRELGIGGKSVQCPGPNCGRWFRSQHGQVYCSLSCAKTMPQEPRNCPRCGKELPRLKPSHRARVVHCSQKCAQAARAEALKITVPCEGCSTPIETTVKQGRRFCSVQCANTAMAIARIVRPLRGVEANRGRRNAKRVLPQCCEICGWDEDTVDSAHIIPVRDGGSHGVDNIVMLCPNHHRLFDHGKIPASTLLAIVQARPAVA